MNKIKTTIMITILFSLYIFVSNSILAKAITVQEQEKICFLNEIPETETKIKALSSANGKTYEENLDSVFNQAKKSMGEGSSSFCENTSLKKTLIPMKSLPHSYFVGDVFFNPYVGSGMGSASLRYGHVGIYTRTSSIAETNPSTSTRYREAQHLWVDFETSQPVGTRILHISVPWMNGDQKWWYRQRAAEFAKYHGERRTPYSWNFWANRLNQEANQEMNCSELVWRAFMYGGIDVDEDMDKFHWTWDSAVFPDDIGKSYYAYWYKTLA